LNFYHKNSFFVQLLNKNKLLYNFPYRSLFNFSTQQLLQQPPGLEASSVV
jgi:hypothetical protein